MASKKIVFLCEGNICRSVTAEFVFKDLLAKQGLSNDYEVISRGVTRETEGKSIYPLALEELEKHNIPVEDHKATVLTPKEYNQADYVVAMDHFNIVLLGRLIFLRNKEKIHLLLDFDGSSNEVSDPYFSRDFDLAYREIEKGCKAFLTYLINNAQ